MVSTGPNIERIRILTPLDLQGIILNYLRNIFSTDVVNGLKWNSDPEFRTVAIEVADKDDQELLNIRPSIFVSIGTIRFDFTAMGADAHGIRPRAAFHDSDTGIKYMSESSKDQILLQSFPVKIAIYSSKTESYQLAYILTKLMMAFRQALEKESNLRTITNFTVSPPSFISNLDGDVYRSEINFVCEFLDCERIIDVAPLIRVSYIETKNQNDTVDKKMWVDEADVFFNDEEE